MQDDYWEWYWKYRRMVAMIMGQCFCNGDLIIIICGLIEWGVYPIIMWDDQIIPSIWGPKKGGV